MIVIRRVPELRTVKDTRVRLPYAVAVAIAEATNTPHSFDVKTAEDERAFQ